jgi:hypothetical protein
MVNSVRAFLRSNSPQDCLGRCDARHIICGAPTALLNAKNQLIVAGTLRFSFRMSRLIFVSLERDHLGDHMKIILQALFVIALTASIGFAQKGFDQFGYWFDSR